MSKASGAARSVLGIVMAGAGLMVGTQIAVRMMRHDDLFTEVSGAIPHQPRETMAFVIMSPGDCMDYLDTVELLERPTIKVRLPFVGIRLVGKATDTTTVRRELDERGLSYPLGVLSGRTIGALREIGVHQTPTLVVFGPSGALRLSYRLPATVRAREDFLRLLSNLPRATDPSAVRPMLGTAGGVI